jgi:hypothetical protein
MSDFIANSNMYNINTENEIASVLSHFNSEFIFDIIRDNLEKKFNYSTINAPNIVISFEQNFKQIMSIYQTNLDEINAVRIATYKEIINIICKSYNLQFNDSDDIDYYSAAMYLYDFLVANFSNYMELFFANYIYKERNAIYDALNLGNMKKNKDSSTLYGKKTYKDIKLAIINANLEYVIQNICVYDIDLHTVLSNIYPDKNIVNYISNIISPIYDFFKTAYVSVLQSDINAMVLSNIRFKIQNLSIDTNN